MLIQILLDGRHEKPAILNRPALPMIQLGDYTADDNRASTWLH
jgi:hypothetical protein